MLAFIFFALLSINDPNNLQDGNSTIKHHKHIFKNRCDGKQKKCQNKKTEKPSRNCNPQTRHSTQSSQQGKAQNEPLQNASYPTWVQEFDQEKKARPNQDLDVKIILLLCVSWRFVIYMLGANLWMQQLQKQQPWKWHANTTNRGKA